MIDLLVASPMKFWESPPTYDSLKKLFPNGVPENFVTISTGGAQNDLDILRLDEVSIAISVGQGENPDVASSINSFGRNLEILRRTGNGWTDLTEKVFPYPLRANQKAQLHPDGRLVITKDSEPQLLVFRYNGTRFIQEIKTTF